MTSAEQNLLNFIEIVTLVDDPIGMSERIQEYSREDAQLMVSTAAGLVSALTEQLETLMELESGTILQETAIECQLAMLDGEV